jgi:DNA-binding MarR family transcriptional regulator
MGGEPARDELNLGLLCYIAYRATEERVLAALAAAEVTKQTVGFLVAQLERAGYVRRVPDPTDARARLVQMAPRGEAAVAVARVAEAEIEAEWTAHLGEQAAGQLRRALTRLREVTDPYR